MSIFSLTPGSNQKGDSGATAWERRRGRESASGGGGGLSIVARDLTVTGDLEADGVIRIEGRVVGNVRAGDQVLLCDGGTIEGNITTREVVVGGTVHGSITASERVELQAEAVVEGDIATRRLLVHEGGTMNGAVRMEAVDGER